MFNTTLGGTSKEVKLRKKRDNEEKKLMIWSEEKVGKKKRRGKGE